MRDDGLLQSALDRPVNKLAYAESGTLGLFTQVPSRTTPSKEQEISAKPADPGVNLGRALTGSILLAALLGFAGLSEARDLPPSVLPGLVPSSVRKLVDVDLPPWRGVVRVQTEVGSHCTGALVGPRLVLTAAHCLFGRGTTRLVRPGSIHVLTGYGRGDYAGHSRARSIEIGAGFAMGLDGQPVPSSPIDADWAMLTIDTPLGTDDRVLPLARELPKPGTPAMLGGYEQDRGQVLVADVACSVGLPVRDAQGHMLLQHSCAATRGASGAPLLVRVLGERWAVVGVVSSARVGTSGGFAVPASAITAPLAGAQLKPKS